MLQKEESGSERSEQRCGRCDRFCPGFETGVRECGLSWDPISSVCGTDKTTRLDDDEDDDDDEVCQQLPRWHRPTETIQVEHGVSANHQRTPVGSSQS